MSVQVTTTALDAKYNREPDRNGLTNVITNIDVIVTVTNTETGQTESQAMEVPLKWARPSSFNGIENVTAEMLQQWAENRIAEDETLHDYHTRLVKDLTKLVTSPPATTSTLFGFTGETDV